MKTISDDSILWKSVGLALFTELAILAVLGLSRSGFFNSQKFNEDTSRFIEAQIFEPPQIAHLVEQKPSKIPAKKELAISKAPEQGRVAPPTENQFPEQNQTESGSSLAATHGPIAIFSPAPSLPNYLKDKELHTSVVIDFFVSSKGLVTLKMVGSSGNEELDALAILSAKKWQFKPAEQNHRPIDAKVRLRIMFEVQ